MNKLIIKNGTEAEFFQRGRKLAQLADRRTSALPADSVITFEDVQCIRKLLTARRIELLRAIKAQPGSVSAISGRLARNPRAVKRDVDQLESAGLVKVKSRASGANDRIEEVKLAAQQLKLEVLLV